MIEITGLADIKSSLNLHTTPTHSLSFLYNLTPTRPLLSLQNLNSPCFSYHLLQFSLTLFFLSPKPFTQYPQTTTSDKLLIFIKLARDDGSKGRFGFEFKPQLPSSQYPKSSTSESHVILYSFLFSFWLQPSKTLLERGFHFFGYVLKI